MKKKVEHLFYKTCRHLVTFFELLLSYDLISFTDQSLDLNFNQDGCRTHHFSSAGLGIMTLLHKPEEHLQLKLTLEQNHKTSWWANKHGTLQWVTTTQVQKQSGSSAPFPFRSFLSDPTWNITDMEDNCFVFINNNRNIEIIFTFNKKIISGKLCYRFFTFF